MRTGLGITINKRKCSVGRDIIKGHPGGGGGWGREGDVLEVEKLEVRRPIEQTEFYNLAHYFRERRRKNLV